MSVNTNHVPIQAPYTDVSNATIKDKEKIVPPKSLEQDKPHSHKVPVQTHDYTIGITSQKYKNRKCTSRTHPQVKRMRQSGGRFELNIWFEPDGDKWDVNIPPKITWVCKLETHLEI